MTPVSPRNVVGKTQVTCFYEFFVLEEFLESSFEGLSLPSRFETDLSASVTHLEHEQEIDREEIKLFFLPQSAPRKKSKWKKCWQPRLTFKVISLLGLHCSAHKRLLFCRHRTLGWVAPSVKPLPDKKLEKRTWERAFELAPLLLPGAKGASLSFTGDTPFTELLMARRNIHSKKCRWLNLT